MSYPTDHKAETLALSAVMRGGHGVRHAFAEGLRPVMFDRGRYAEVAEVVLDLLEGGARPDAETVKSELESGRVVDEIIEHRCPPVNIDQYVERIRHAFYRRRIMVVCDRGIEAAQNGDDPLEIGHVVEGGLLKLSREMDGGEVVESGPLARAVLEQLEEEHGEEITGVPSGFRRLDLKTRGWQPSDLIVIAARPSMGKTSFALACALNAATHPKEETGVAIFSLEMSDKQLMRRMIGSEARVNVRQTTIPDQEWQRLARASGKIEAAPIFIDDTPGLDVAQLKARARRLKAEKDIGLIVIDYLQLLKGPPGRGYENRNKEVGGITRELKLIAKELELPVIALAQLSRAVEKRGGEPRPMLSDLRDSGEIEEHTDVVCFLYRPEYYGMTEDIDTGESLEGIAEIIIGKQRNGPTVPVEVAFVERFAAFEPLTRHPDSSEDTRPQSNGHAPTPPTETPF